MHKYSENLPKITSVLKKTAPFLIAFMFGLTAFTSMQNIGASTDEKFHFTRGIMLLKTGDYRLNQHHPFLFNAILASPELLDKDLVIPETEGNKKWEQADKDGLSFDLRELNGGLEGFTTNVLFWPRTLMIAIASGFLIWMFYLLKNRFGYFIALISTILLATSPTYLAHSRLVTTDVPSAITIFLSTIALYDYVKAKDKDRWRKLFIFIFAYFIALITKYSAVTIVVAYAVVIILDEFIRRNNFWNFVLEVLKKGALIGGSLVLLLSTAYKFQFATLQEMQYGNETKITYAYNDINSLREMGWPPYITENILYLYEKVKLPFPQYFHGFYENVINHNIFGHQSFFLGERSDKGWPLYFPVSFIIKENLSTVFLTVFAILLGTWYIAKKAYKNKFNYRNIDVGIVALILTPALMWALSIESSLNIGVRYLLPEMIFMYLLVAVILYAIYKKYPKAILITLSITVIANILSLAINYPYYIPYFNESIIPSTNRHHYLRDSSFNWHQNDLLADRMTLNSTDIHKSLETTPAGDKIIIAINTLWRNSDVQSEEASWLFAEYLKEEKIHELGWYWNTHVLLLLDENPYYIAPSTPQDNSEITK